MTVAEFNPFANDVARPDGRMYNPTIEKLSGPEMRSLQLEALNSQLDYVANHSPFYQDMWNAAGFDPRKVTSLESFSAPFTTKEQLRESQLAAPPLGLHAGAPIRDVIRIHASSGTTGHPNYVGITRRDLLDWTEVVSRALYSQGVRPDDIVIHAFGLGFFVGGLPLKDATENIGATFVPIGTGSSERVIQSIKDLNATVLMCTSSYATYLAEYCRSRFNLDPAELGLQKLLVGAEPGGSIPAVRDRLESDFGATLADGMGNADVFPIYLANCEEQDGLHVLAEDQLLLELVNPNTGELLNWENGAEGELVATHLHRECVPLVRLRTRDLVSVNTDACACGRTSPRLHCFGRSDDLLFVAGVNVWPSAVKDVIASMEPRTTGAVRIVLTQSGPVVEPPLRVQVEYGRDEDDLDGLRGEIERSLREKLTINARIDLVPPHTLPRWEMKAQLVKKVSGGI